MGERHFISQTALTPLPSAEVDGRVIMADFTVFHKRPNNSEHFVDPDQEGVNSEDYQAGVEAGKAEAANVYESTIRVMEETLEQLKTTLATKLKEIENSHARVVLQSLEAVLPALAERSLMSEMQTVILQTASQEIEGPLVAQLHPNNETVKSYLLKNGPKAMSIEEIGTMSESAVNFAWGVSRVEIDPQTNAEKCLMLLNQALPTLPMLEKPQDPTEPDPSIPVPSIQKEEDML